LGAAKAVPLHAEELAQYRYVSPEGVYPHNQWIEAWLETGLPGVLIALALVWLVLRRVQSPFALAAIGTALIASALNFEITTDSWWAALAASALLFRLTGQLPTRNM
jgi:O-antigen ligase